jgi:transcriptional regulator with XRE-family HTH domain
LNLTQSFYAKIEAGNPKLSLELFFQLINILELDYVGLFTQIKKRRQSVANVDVINNKIVK